MNTVTVGEEQEKIIIEFIGEADKEKGMVVEEGVVEISGGVVEKVEMEEIFDELEEEKMVMEIEGEKEVVVVVDHCNQAHGIDGGKNNDVRELGVGKENICGGGKSVDDGGVVMGNVLEENNNENVEMISSDIFVDCNLSGFRDWCYEWDFYYPFYWESEYGAYYYWDVLGNEALANQWVENVWKD